MNKKKKIAFLLSPKTSLAVWNSLKLHIDLCGLCGVTVDIYKPKNMHGGLVQEEYWRRIKEYDGYRKLRKLISNESYDYIWCPDYIRLLLLRFLFVKNTKIIYWVQGTGPYESLMKHGNHFKFTVLSLIEKLGFSYSDAYIFVSESMREFYENRYNIKNKCSIIVPCLSEFTLTKKIEHNRRKKNSYVYIGGISAWQCFNETLEIYAKIRTNDTVFHIITPDINKAKELVCEKFGVANDIEIYCIKDRTKIPEVLSTFEYGFLIRKESPVNYVASPIKFVEYLSCGVNVILTKALPSYARMVEQYSIGTVIDLNDECPRIKKYSEAAIKVYLEKFDKSIFMNRYKSLLGKL